jgi:hypothetical protein
LPAGDARVYDDAVDELIRCAACGGFMPAAETLAACPHCGDRPPGSLRRRLTVVLGLAGAASLGLTMMACYGAPPCEPGTSRCPNTHSNDGGTPDGGATP